jgi:hypothetical protein
MSPLIALNVQRPIQRFLSGVSLLRLTARISITAIAVSQTPIYDPASPGPDHTAMSQSLKKRALYIQGKIKPPKLTPANALGAEPVDTSLPWAPPATVPLFGTPSYERLDDVHRLRYNHYYALLLAEQFIWLEDHFTVRPARRLLQATMEPEMRSVLQSFLTDELSHTETFWQLIQKAAPRIYPEQKFAFFHPPQRLRLLARLCALAPGRLPAWTLFTGSVEELTIQISRAYKENAGQLDEQFTSAFCLHAVDEARHCLIDGLLADWLINPLSAPWRRLAASILKQVFRAYYDTDWGHEEPIARLIQDFPELTPLKADMLRDVVAARGPSFCAHVFSDAHSPLTARNARQHAMLRDAIAAVAGT